MKLKYDLHIHSALSPCADNDMTPSSIAGFRLLSGADVISICDHNSALNTPYAKKACDEYKIRFIPGIEVNTAEEIHVLCYFSGVGAALEMGEIIYRSLPDIKVDSDIWGEQLVINESDEVVGRVEKLLTVASSLDIYSVKSECERLGGIAVPAHVDRDSYSVLSVLGFMPDDLEFLAIEMARPEKYRSLADRKMLPENVEVLSSSDAHNLAALINEDLPSLDDESVLMRLLGL
jgi:PHP family Zn ribbon phosphoesterase